MENVRAIKVKRRSFELVSGLKINFAKKQFWGDWDVKIVDEECCKILKLQFVVCTFSLLGYSDRGKPKI